MDYSERVEQVNDYDYSDEPLQAVVDRQRDIIELQAREIMRLRSVIHESKPNCQHGLPSDCCAICASSRRAQYAPGENGHQAFGTGKQSW